MPTIRYLYSARKPSPCLRSATSSATLSNHMSTIRSFPSSFWRRESKCHQCWEQFPWTEPSSLSYNTYSKAPKGPGSATTADYHTFLTQNFRSTASSLLIEEN